MKKLFATILKFMIVCLVMDLSFVSCNLSLSKQDKEKTDSNDKAGDEEKADVEERWDTTVITDDMDSYTIGKPCNIKFAEGNIECDKDIPDFYADYLRSNPEYNDWPYALIYIDSDNTPELILEGTCEADGYAILSKQKDSIVVLNTSRLYFCYIEKSGLCGYENGHMGVFYSQFFKLENGDFNNFIDFYAEETDYTDDGPTKIQSKLYHNGKRVESKKLYDILQKEFYNKGKVIDTNQIKFRERSKRK